MKQPALEPVPTPTFAQLAGRPLQGTVFGPARASFVPGAQIVVPHPERKTPLVIVADETGSFAIDSLPPGSYPIQVEDPRGRHFGREVMVTPGGPRVAIELERAYMVSGAITEERSGRSVEGVRVALRRVGDGAVVASALSGPTGSFELRPVPAGECEIHAEVPGGMRRTVFVLADVTNLELTIPDVLYCRGLILRSTGPGSAPYRLAGATVQLIDAEEQELGRTVTDEAGMFRIPAPPPGTYGLLAREPDGSGIGKAILTVPPAGRPADLRVVIEGPARIAGQLTYPEELLDESSVRVWLLEHAGAEIPMQVAYPKNGRFAFGKGVAPGRYVVSAFAFLDDRELAITQPIAVQSDDALTLELELE